MKQTWQKVRRSFSSSCRFSRIYLYACIKWSYPSLESSISCQMQSSNIQIVMTPQARAEATNSIPLRRFGNASEIAEAALFLATNQYANNCVLNLDGGLSAMWCDVPTRTSWSYGETTEKNNLLIFLQLRVGYEEPSIDHDGAVRVFNQDDVLILSIGQCLRSLWWWRPISQSLCCASLLAGRIDKSDIWYTTIDAIAVAIYGSVTDTILSITIRLLRRRFLPPSNRRGWLVAFVSITNIQGSDRDFIFWDGTGYVSIGCIRYLFIHYSQFLYA